MATEDAVTQAEPQTPTKAEFRFILYGDITFSSTENTPLKTPERGEGSILSQQDSVSTDVTSDYGWDIPAPEQSVTLQNDLLASPTPKTLLRDKKRELMRPIRESLTTGNGRPQGLILRRARSIGCLTLQLKVPFSALEEQGGCFAPPQSLNLLLQDKNLEPEKLDNRRPQGFILRKAKSADCLSTRQKTLKRKFSVHASVSKNELRWTEIFLQMKESSMNLGARNLKRPRRNVQEFSTSEREELKSRDSPILKSDCIDTNFRKKGWGSQPQASDPGITASSAGSTIVPPAPNALSDANAISELLAKIIPSDIYRRLTKDRERCVAPVYNDNNKRCSRNRKGDIQELYASLKMLKTVQFPDNLQWIEQFIGSSRCTHHKNSTIKLLNECHLDFGKLPHTQSTKSSASKPGSISATGKSETKGGPLEAISRPIRQLQVFTPYPCPGEQVGKLTSHLLEEKIKKPFKIPEKGAKGLIYIYWQPGNFGHLKIGRTNNINTRLRAWERKCGKKLEVYFPQDADKEDMLHVEHICLVESLVHLELREQRKIERHCPGCGKKHIEWFEVSRVVAVEIARKWMRWMRQGQYEEILAGPWRGWMGYKNNGMAGTLADVCQPHRELNASNKTEERG
ncbi:hypothetical protein EMCG_00826 [[Emmonsia] crescens]|uniref:Bacteriophage T5 Orf172 DNA-binding domain-containing protein n=1 Tax=[Emmonsia] crescens TaxID=73230 RepID=A0A0G2IXU0_9EURO|nr:hypothetical protein EMCG_00826 [Emmonsia crescens UAMH 3008]